MGGADERRGNEPEEQNENGGVPPDSFNSARETRSLREAKEGRTKSERVPQEIVKIDHTGSEMNR